MCPDDVLGGDDRAAWSRTLAKAWERATSQIDALTRELDEIIEGAELVSTDDEHDPEGATIAYERAKATALLAQARKDLVTLDRARRELAGGRLVRCARCGGPIALERLLALPTASTCISCASR